MGMYDNIICHYPLPGKVPSYVNKDHLFQTKDLDCYLSVYLIDSDGKLFLRKYTDEYELEKPKYAEELFDGTVNFYTTNMAGAGPGIYTRNGEDCESIEYKAIFTNGKLTGIVQTEYTVQPALPSSAMRFYRREIDNVPSVKVGQSIYVKGYNDAGYYAGYYAVIVADTDSQLCVKNPTGKLELINRSSGGVAFFETEQAAKEEENRRNSHWEKQRSEYDTYVQEWKKKHED